MYDDYVVIVPVGEDFILTQRQYKPGAKKVCNGFPAGFIKKDEQPLSAAKRELMEETGYEAAKWITLGTFYDNVSVSAAKFTIFLAEGLTLSGIHANPDKSESAIENIKVTKNSLLAVEMEGACMALAKKLSLHPTQ
jgi:ADP-ribose pyrophosphatase